MAHYVIPINTLEEEVRSWKLAAFFVALATGVAGFVVGIALSLPYFSSESQLANTGGVAIDLTVDSREYSETPDTAATLPAGEVAGEATTEPEAAVEAPIIIPPDTAETDAARAERVSTLTLAATERENAISLINQEMSLIKDRSVSLIAEFTGNCGSWRDDCALPYKKELDANNARYAVLSATLEQFTRERDAALLERATILGE